MYRFTPWHSWHFGTLAFWHFENSPTDIGGFFFFGGHHPRILVWFSMGCIYWADPNQDYMGQRKEKTMKYACIFYIIRILELENAGNADSMAVSVNIFLGIIPLHTLHSCTL